MTCSRCGADEWRRQKSHNYHYWECVPCRRRSRHRDPAEKRADNLLRRYGITDEDYLTMFYEQDGRCAICHKTMPKGKRLHIDHDHESGEVRGLLCWNCNTGLGKFGENPAVLRAAIRYLRQGA